MKEKQQKKNNLKRLNPFSLDKIKKNPIKIKNPNTNKANIGLNILSKINYINENTDKKFFNKTLNNLGKSNSFITKENNNKLSLSNNQIADDIIKSWEKELKEMISEKNIQNICKILVNFQNQLICRLGEKYNKSEIKNVLKINFDEIIEYLNNYFEFYKKKCQNYLSSIKKRIKNFLIKKGDKSIDNNWYNTSENSSQIINNYTNNNNNIIIFDENQKKQFLNEEENIVNLINNLSTNIRTINKKYKSSLFNIANLIDYSNNKLVEVKNKLQLININAMSKYSLNYKNLNESINDMDKVYSININIINEIQSLDNNQKIFFEEAKEIFNNLKINHKIKIKEYQKLFKSIQNIQSNSKSKENNSINCYYTINNLSLNKKNRNKKFYNYNDKKEKRGKSLPNKIKTEINELKYLKLNVGNNRTRNISNYLNETSMSNKTMNNNYNISNVFNNTNPNSFYKSNIVDNILTLYKNESNNKYNKIEIEKVNDINYLANIMIEFFSRMNNLQKSIINKKPNINILKKDFELFKRKIIEYLQIIIDKNKDKDIDNDINNKNYYNTIKLRKVQNESYSLIPKIENKNLKNIDSQDLFLNLEVKNKELNIEINKLKEEIDKLINDKNLIKSLILKFVDVINNNIIKEFDIFNINSINLNNELNLFYSNNKNDENEANNEKIYLEQIDKIINELKSYITKIKIILTDLKEEKEKLSKELQDKLLKEEKYKDSLDKEIFNNKKDNKESEKNNIEEEKNNKKSKTSLTFDVEGDISFKGESFKINNNLQSIEDNNKYISPLIDNNTTGSFTNINYNCNKMNNNSKNSSDKNLNIKTNESNDENKNLEIKESEINTTNNNNFLDINKEILKYQNNLKNKIKSLEEEVEIQKNKNLNFFIEIKNELYDFNEEKISLSKYTNLMKLYEKEKETTKNLEKKYINFVEKINNNLLNYFKKINCEIEIEGIESNIISISPENSDKNSKKFESKLDLNKSSNLHFDYSNKSKTKSLLMMEENNYDEKNNKDLKIKNLMKENNSLKKNEKLLLEQLNAIKKEIKELNGIIQEKEEKIKMLNSNFGRETLLQREQFYISLRNGIELLITEINLTNKIKDILRGMLNILLYKNEEIEKIFKYKDKKKNIIGIFQFIE